MDKTTKKLLGIFSRYILVLLLALGNLFVFYKVFTRPTIFFSKLILSLFGETTGIGVYIIFRETLLEIAPACVAGAAYYLLFVLSLSVPMNLQKRIKLLVYCFGVFFVVNVLRIASMGLLLQTPFFDSVHMLLWNFFSTIFLISIWFSAVKIFKIKEIPIYTDFLSIVKSKKAKTHN